MRKILIFLSLLSLSFFLSVGIAQIPKLKIKIPKEIPGLDKILNRESVLTTTIDDAVTEVPFLDDFNLEIAEPMTVLPRTQDGGFVLDKPGNYVFECQSYCLRAGTYGPGRDRGGGGYLYAPLKGPQADIIKNVLKRSYLHPEISQEDIQILLWAIIARTKITDMSPKMQAIAFKLLTKKEILRINSEALELIPEKLLNKAFAKLPPPVQQIMKAEARLREMLTEATASYEELEHIAVLRGEPPIEEGDRPVPIGRWSFHPHGYFVRFFPDDYRVMLIELYVPEPVKIEKDSLGRITSISVFREISKEIYDIIIEKLQDKYLQLLSFPEQEISRLDIIYEDIGEIPVFTEESSLKVYTIKSLRFETLKLERFETPDLGFDQSKIKIKIQKEWSKRGWTFSGVPTGEEKVDTTFNRFPDIKERYRMALIHKQEINNLNEGVNSLLRKKKKLSQDGLKEIIDLGHLAMAVQKIIEKNDSKQANWLHGPVELVKMAWQSTLSKYLKRKKEIPVFNPAEDPVPGRAFSQRLGSSGRSSMDFNECIDEYVNCKKEAKEFLEMCTEVCIDTTKYSRGDKLTPCLFRCYEEYIHQLENCLSSVRKCVR